MVPVPTSLRHAHSSRLLYTFLTLSAQHVQRLLRRDGATLVNPHERRTTRFDPHTPKEIVFVILIPVLVLLSGVFAGLTLGYMSLDETQLNVLSISGTP
jgi:metal transporter CNNM